MGAFVPPVLAESTGIAKYFPMRDYFTRHDVLQCAAALCGVRFARGTDAADLTTNARDRQCPSNSAEPERIARRRSRPGRFRCCLEDGRPQDHPLFFARERDLPLTLGLMVNTSGGQAAHARR